jgi:membrane associated rhomboid family serine protease
MMVEATPRVFVTPAIIIINLTIFAAMLVFGVSPIDPNIEQLLKWGADYGPVTLNGQWWRLLSCAFVHIGALHLALNMWCLWNLGRLAERMFGALLQYPLTRAENPSRLRAVLAYAGVSLALLLGIGAAYKSNRPFIKLETANESLEAGDFDQAIARYKEALEIKPDLAVARNDLMAT